MTAEQETRWEELQEQACEHNKALVKLGEEAKTLLQVTESEWEEAWHMANEGARECGADYPEPGSADGIWTMLDEVICIRERMEQDGKRTDG